MITEELRTDLNSIIEKKMPTLTFVCQLTPLLLYTSPPTRSLCKLSTLFVHILRLSITVRQNGLFVFESR